MTPKRKSIEKFKETIRKVTWRRQPVKPEEMTGRLNSVIRGWENYFKIENVRWIFRKLDEWIRTRVRTFIEKKKSEYAKARIPNYALKSGYKLASLMTLV